MTHTTNHVLKNHSRIVCLMSMFLLSIVIYAQQSVHINTPETWVKTDLNSYVGQTVSFTNRWYVCSNYGGKYTISPRRIYSPTNQVLPGSSEYSSTLSLNYNGTIQITGISDYHRTGEILHNLTVKVNNGSLQFISGDWIGNSRADMEKGYDSLSIDYKGKHDVLVCAMNLEYYLVESFGTGYGPDDASDHAKQRAKVSKALAKINADLYGLVEIEQGQSALREIAQDLTRNTGRPFAFVNDGGSANGSYTKAGYVYCSDVIEPKGTLRVNNTGVRNRKYMQLFEHKQSGERFIYSINHFKAKSGSGSGGDADQGDGQGSYNAARVKEAASVLTQYRNNRTLYQENDILIMGDLNAYGKEDPIRLLVDSGMTDLHRYFHADSSYSYTYRNEAGYLDHALCNSTLLPQVTGMVAYHINSDELDQYTYDKSNDQTMFRSSDHDPVLVGLKLSAVSTLTPVINTMDVLLNRSNICIKNAAGGYVRIYSINGNLIAQKKIDSDLFTVQTGTLPCGMYIIHLFHNQQLKRVKMLVQ